MGFLFAGTYNSQVKRVAIDMNRGSSANVEFVLVDNSAVAPGDGRSSTSQSSETGAIEEEINRIRNKISYPALALEQGLEAECSWIVEINRENRAGRITPDVPCRFKIFENEFLAVIRDWKFNQPENTVIKIPVSFKIKRDSN